MFHENLQRGIALAIQQGKLVTCFISDEKEESQRWETEWLPHDEVRDLLADRTVLLRIRAGTQEEGFLSAFCSISAYPSLVVIQNGQLLGRIESQASFDDFSRQINAVLDTTAAPEPSRAEPAQQTPAQPAFLSPASPSPADIPQTRPQETAASESPTPTSAIAVAAARSAGSTSAVKESKGKEPAKSARKPTAKPKPASTPQDARNEWVVQQKKRQQEARKERERILAAIEADKAERRRQRANMQASAGASPTPSDTSSDLLSPLRTSSTTTTRSQPSEVPLQIRLPSGKRIREFFPASATIAADVRPWIDAAFRTELDLPSSAAVPAYTLTHILPPATHPLSAPQEARPLADPDLNFLPAATLLLVPVRGGANAYAHAGSADGVAGRVAGCFDWAWRAAGGIVQGAADRISGTMFGYGAAIAGSWPQGRPQPAVGEGLALDGASERSRGSAAGAVAARRGGGKRIRTLADQRGEDERQTYYNGNQLSFESRNRDDE